MLTLFALSSLDTRACREYDWDGNPSSNWNVQNNWSPGAGTQNLSADQVYNIGDPADWDASNAPVISANNVWQVDGIQIFEGGSLTISGGTTAIDQDLYIYDNGDLVISGGSLSVDNIYMIDAGSSITVSGGTLSVSGDIFLGRENNNNSQNNANGSPALNITSGFVECFNLRFYDTEGDSPVVNVSGGELEVTTAIRTDGAPVDINLSGGVIDVQGDVLATEGSDNFTMSGGEIFVEGDWDLAGTANITGGRFNLVSSIAQTISNDNGITFDTLIVNNSSAGGIQLTNGPVTIRDSVALIDGVISNDASAPVVLADNILISGGGTGCYVDGFLSKAGNDAFTFIVGDASSLNPVSISAPSSTTDTFTVGYFDVDPDGTYSGTSLAPGINNISQREYWIIEQTGSSSVTVTLSWDANSGPINNLSELRIVRWDSDSLRWENEGNGGTTGDATSGTIVSAGPISQFSPFTFGSTSFSNPLPVLWEVVAVDQKELVNVIKWTTAAEMNCSHYQVQRSKSGDFFTDIGTVPSEAMDGNSNVPLDYYFTDQEPIVGTSFYRILQVDFDGATSYSKTVAVDRNSERLTTGSETLRFVHSMSELGFFSAEEYPASRMVVYALDGKQLFDHRAEISVGFNNVPLLDQLSSGVYVIRITDASSGEVIGQKKFVHVQR